ncbi:MAG: DUF4173 domain-containing protein [Pseudomonadota bacterium]
MTKRIYDGVPLCMQQDGWWLDTPKRGPDPQHATRRRDTLKAGVLVALIACGDVLVWGVVPGVSFAIFALLVVWAGLALAFPSLTVRARVGVAAGAVLAVLPLIEVVQPLSVLIAVCGVSALCAALAGVGRSDLLRGALRVWWVAPVQTGRDAAAGVRAVGHWRTGPVDLRALVVGWALPIGATLLFAALLIGANPVLDAALSRLAAWDVPSPDLWRLWFWLVLGALVWPLLIAGAMRERLRARRPLRFTVHRPGVLNADSVARSLVAFNALFAVQTGMDVLFLYGSAGLPEGISPATYAHRGAYPLLVTALLAGLFAVLARPYLAGRPVVRWLMLLWLVQTLALVGASVFRLEAYVDAFGLTRLRLAAYVWMGVVACGLAMVMWQVWRDKPAAWMLARSGALGAVVIYACAFTSFDRQVAAHNLSRQGQADTFMLCGLSEDVVPAMQARFGADWPRECVSSYRLPRVFEPADWREWGFRNWRVRRSLAAMTLPDPDPNSAPAPARSPDLMPVTVR